MKPEESDSVHSEKSRNVTSLNTGSIRVAIVTSLFSPKISEGLLEASVAELLRLGVEEKNIQQFFVPGALEIPISLQKMAQTRQFDALIALGAVIRGETYHFEVVSNEASRGVMQVQLQHNIPIANGILTTENETQALARINEKGRDCAKVAVEMSKLLDSLDQL